MRNLSRSKGRVLFLGIVIGLGSACFLVASALGSRIGDVTQRDVIENYSLLRLDVMPPSGDGTAMLTDDVLAAVASRPDVRSVAPILQQLVGMDDAQLTVLATVIGPDASPPIVQQVTPGPITLGPGQVLLPESLDGRSLVPLLDRTITATYTVRIGPNSGETKDEPVRVVGIYAKSWQVDGPNAGYVDASTARRWAEAQLGVGPGELGKVIGYDAAVVIARDQSAIRVIRADLAAQGFVVTDLESRLSAVPGVVRLAQLGGLVLLGTVVLLTAVTAASLMATIVRQRRREIGLLKAIGFTDRAVLGLFMLEVGIIAGGAALLGTIAGNLLSLVTTAWLRSNPDVSAVLGTEAVLPTLSADVIQFVVIVAVALLAALIPAIQSARVEPGVALLDR